MGELIVMIFLLIIGIVYFIPSIVAGRRSHRNCNSIFILNLFLGWTLVGWVISLCWALINEKEGKINKNY